MLKPQPVLLATVVKVSSEFSRVGSLVKNNFTTSIPQSWYWQSGDTENEKKRSRDMKAGLVIVQLLFFCFCFCFSPLFLRTES